MPLYESLNVFGEPLQLCGDNPVTGFFRDGHCNSSDDDVGSHTVCIQATSEFLEYSRFRGNDLSTPMPQHGFDGIKPGDTWCLCAARWLEAYHFERAPQVYLQRTHIKALDIIPFDILKQYALDLEQCVS